MTTRALVVLALALAACGSSDSDQPNSVSTTIQLTVQDPSGSLPTYAHQLLAVFEGTCPTDLALSRAEISSAIQFVKIQQIGKAQSVTIPRAGAVGIAALLRKEDCSLAALGCTPADLSVHTKVVIDVLRLTPPGNPCSSGTCVDGQCK